MSEQQNETGQEILKELGDITVKFIEEHPEYQLPQMPLWRYWSIPKNWQKTRNVFGWTTERDTKEKFYALKYRELRDDSLKLSKSVAFGRKKIAKARSKKWFDQYYIDSS